MRQILRFRCRRVCFSSLCSVHAAVILTMYIFSTFTFSAPPVIIKSDQTTIIGDRGATVELRCPAIGNPQPTITWRKNHRAIAIDGIKFKQKNTGALVISSLLPLDSGTYLCTAKNPTGQDFLILTLHVYSKFNCTSLKFDSAL